MDRHEQARELIDRDGILLLGASGAQRVHPLLRIEHTAAMDVLRGLRLEEMEPLPAESDLCAEFIESPLERIQRQAWQRRRWALGSKRRVPFFGQMGHRSR